MFFSCATLRVAGDIVFQFQVVQYNHQHSIHGHR